MGIGAVQKGSKENKGGEMQKPVKPLVPQAPRRSLVGFRALVQKRIPIRLYRFQTHYLGRQERQERQKQENHRANKYVRPAITSARSERCLLSTKVWP